MSFSVFDGYAGAGGSSSGAEQVAGITVRYAVNHWDLAIATHNENMPHVNHDRVDMTDEHDGDPRRYAYTELGWFSPECTTWSDARGKKVDYAVQQPSLLDDDPPLPDEAVQRSRFQMETVPIFVRHHRYLAFVVENVPAILRWRDLQQWLAELDREGYEHKIVILNSAFAHQLGAPAPQLRDRVFFVFWQLRFRTPDFNKWLRPRCWCSTCGTTVNGIWAAKPGPLRAMRYQAQYTFRCPSTACRNSEVQPMVLPAIAAIDWTLPNPRIGDREKPLKPKTYARIAAGVRRHPEALLSPAGGSRRRDASPLNLPMPTRTTTENDGLVIPPAMLVPVEGRAEIGSARSVDLPSRAQTARLQDALVVPLRNNTTAIRASTGLLPTFAAGGQHHALIMRNNKPRDGADGGNLSTPASEPLRTLTTAGHQSLITLANQEALGHLLYAYDTGLLRPLSLPMPSQTTVQGDALLRLAIDVEDCTFRMLDVHEIRSGMAFMITFRMPYGTKRERVKMLGNAVTPPCSRDLFAMLYEAITGEDAVPAAA